MKKIILLSLLGLIFLSGCSEQKITDIPNPNTEPTKSFEMILPKDVGIYKQPEIIIGKGTGLILAELNSKVENEISSSSTEEEKQNGWKESIVSGYVYTYIYKDLGIKIHTAPLYPPYFFEKKNGLIFRRNGNMIYASGSNNRGAEYIQKFTKDANVSFYDQIKNKHTPNGCKIELFTGYDYNFLPKHNTMVSIMFSDKSFPKSTCTQHDINFPNNGLLIVFLYNPQNPTTYYKISLGDACAPGPCSIFGKIEFF